MRSDTVLKQVVAFVVVLSVLVAGSVAAGFAANEWLTRSVAVTNPRLIEAAPSVTPNVVDIAVRGAALTGGIALIEPPPVGLCTG